MNQKCGYISYKKSKQMSLNIDNITENSKYHPKYNLDDICIENSWYTKCQSLISKFKKEKQWKHECSIWNPNTIRSS
jgi:hypothetical protein